MGMLWKVNQNEIKLRKKIVVNTTVPTQLIGQLHPRKKLVRMVITLVYEISDFKSSLYVCLSSCIYTTSVIHKFKVLIITYSIMYDYLNLKYALCNSIKV